MISLQESIHREVVTDAIDIERISENTFCSKMLWTPFGHPSAYGGQMMGQAIHAVSVYGNQAFGLHSFQCYFLHRTSDTSPLTYQISELKSGRTFNSYLVKATQKEKLCMLLMCSFQKPEPVRLPPVQWPMPDNVPLPEMLDLDMDYYLNQCADASWEMKQVLSGIAQDRARISILLTVSVERTAPDGCLISMRWMRAIGAHGCDLPSQKCILAYMSDFDFIGIAPKALQLQRLGRGPGTVETISTLCHSIYFYSDDLDCSDWLLIVTSAPRAGFGRGLALGKFYTRDGTLIAVAMQEGVVRAYDDTIVAGYDARSKL